MELDEMLEQTNETENVDTQATEELEGGIDLTDTTDDIETPETTVVKKSLKELLKEDPDLQEEFNGMVKTRLDRKDREFQRTLSKYQDTDNVLRKTLNLSETDDVNFKLREAYRDQGVELPEAIKPGLSSREIEILAKSDAQDIIESGYDAMIEEANRLAAKKYENLDEREKIVFTTLAEKLTTENNKKALLKLGAKEDILNDENFNAFRKQFTSNTPIETIYGLYKNNQPKPKVENPGSMKNTTSSNEIKEYYTPEEASKFTRKDYAQNPKLLEAVENSMTKWKK